MVKRLALAFSLGNDSFSIVSESGLIGLDGNSKGSSSKFGEKVVKSLLVLSNAPVVGKLGVLCIVDVGLAFLSLVVVLGLIVVILLLDVIVLSQEAEGSVHLTS